jgi:very-short-patch-repair endonuclease
MTRLPGDDADPLTWLLFAQAGVVTREQALGHLSRAALEHRVRSGRWQHVHRGVYLAHSGEITGEQEEWIAVLATGPRSYLAGLSAAVRYGLCGYRADAVHVLLPAGRRADRPPARVIVHRSAVLADRDVVATRPPINRPVRALVDAAQWATNDDRARAIIAAGYQQGLVFGREVQQMLDRLPTARRRRLIARTAHDASGGSHSIAELDYLRLCRRHRLPAPVRQVRRVDRAGRGRYLDAVHEPWGVHVEIDGGQHTDVLAWWSDMRRQNDLWIPGDRVLRFPAWVIRERPAEVAGQLRAALTSAGWRPGAMTSGRPLVAASPAASPAVSLAASSGRRDPGLLGR